ncbi:GntR family transcriptional regulator [Nocardioides bruguierae]|uniref:GntR family transcriptional regulator n=1 Tax=Nocardioides bruguierae TaxID=2945102 RepID=A0A9X2D931_9ACTN|nr:GntR family transcriptional regulator [Nocardioides bruguierae]MCM0621410.1 GntR family transcriptional regulator [Nocardioides bruguierae]
MPPIDDPAAPAAERAYRAVKEDILTGAVRGGSLLSEVEVGAPLGISRTPVHEAFLRLQAEGLLELVPRRGAVVVPVAPGEARDVLEVRRALESAAVRRLVSPGQDAARDRLATAVVALLAEQERLAAAGDVAGFARADTEFHATIVEASGNAVATGFYASLGDRQRRMAIGSIGAHTEHLVVLAEEHRSMAAEVAACDPDAFEASLRGHLSRTHAVLLGGAW